MISQFSDDSDNSGLKLKNIRLLLINKICPVIKAGHNLQLSEIE